MFAHPDDDAYGIAGTVALHADDPDFRFVLVHATDGDQGDIRPGFPATRDTLGAVRRAEDEAGWRAVGRSPDRHEWLGLPDGGVSGVPFGALVDAIWEVLADERPDVVCTFGPDGIFGHPDHVAVGAATDAAFARGVGDGGPGFRRLVHGVIPQTVFERWNTQRAALGLEIFDPSAMYHMRGVPDETVDIWVDTSSVADRTVAGLLEHRSQHHVIFDEPIDVDRWRRVVTREWHTIAWPSRDPGRSFLTDVFDGLT
ncbi:GlcNAc-PI de-N-acetylase [Knoellia subterranea KCTC 19937]|uniref:GlcNAc-PI de-N-acetylase n=1 Tax=Knoellia subterranea KCTC 19937 TaxID=1385521 RepID=A0A0A0JIL9_9MICO|nr:GlcNAc-PI de-N-acetylase [Knoellia subterranea KCTC 19937]